MSLLRSSLTTAATLVFAAGTVGNSLFAQADQPPTPPPPSFVEVEDDPALPRVLLIGDSISMGYTLPTRELLQGEANVHRPQANCGPTSRGVKQIDAWLGEGQWDVIHFNFGLHDLRILEDGNHQVPIEQYEENLRKIVERMKETGATLIWCSTTPVPEGELNPPRSDADVVAYNQVAAKIMEEHGIAIHDLYSFALPQLAEIQRPANVHFTPDGSEVLAGKVAEVIEAALKPEAGEG